MRTLTGTLQTAQDSSPHKAYVEALVVDESLRFNTSLGTASPSTPTTNEYRGDAMVAADNSILTVTVAGSTTGPIYYRRVTTLTDNGQWSTWTTLTGGLDAANDVIYDVTFSKGAGNTVYLFILRRNFSTLTNHVSIATSADNGATWGNFINQFTVTSITTYPFLAATGGLDLMMYSASSSSLVYRTWNGAAWSAEIAVPLYGWYYNGAGSLLDFNVVHARAQKVSGKYYFVGKGVTIGTYNEHRTSVFTFDGSNWGQETPIQWGLNTGTFGWIETVNLAYFDSVWHLGVNIANIRTGPVGTRDWGYLTSPDFTLWSSFKPVAQAAVSGTAVAMTARPGALLKVGSTHYYIDTNGKAYIQPTATTLNISSDVERYQVQPHPDAPVSEAVTLEVANE